MAVVGRDGALRGVLANNRLGGGKGEHKVGLAALQAVGGVGDNLGLEVGVLSIELEGDGDHVLRDAINTGEAALGRGHPAEELVD